MEGEADTEREGGGERERESELENRSHLEGEKYVLPCTRARRIEQVGRTGAKSELVAVDGKPR